MEHLGRILVVEPDAAAANVVVRECRRLRRTTVVASATEARRVLAEAPKLTALILEQRLPDGTGLTVLKEYRSAYPRTPFLVLTADLNSRLINRCHLLGAEFVAKPTHRRNLKSFLQRSVAFERVPDRRVAAVIQDLVRSHRLSPRETDVVAAATQGTSRKVIADQLGTTENTVKSCVRGLLRKCDAMSLEDVARMVWIDALAGSDVHDAEEWDGRSTPATGPFSILPPPSPPTPTGV